MLHQNVRKPFDEFKWRWASYTPSEGLNDPRVHLSVLRAMRIHEGESPRSEEFFASLQVIENDLAEYLPRRLHLARDQDRNILRNSQQYWSGLDLLKRTTPAIELTSFGRKVADNEITREEFSAATIRTLSLPNFRIENLKIVRKWESANIQIKPLALILEIIYQLGKSGSVDSYLTNEELVRVVIPLSSLNATIDEHVDHVRLFRQNSGIFDAYEDFAPESNDKRMSREHLLFLTYHGFLSISNIEDDNFIQQFHADARSRKMIRALLRLQIEDLEPQEVAESISETGEIGMLQRERRLVSVTARPGQSKFRRDVLAKSGSKCLLSGETLSVVLRACHIIPVEQMGTDEVGNGICLREDLHILFDAGHIRIDSLGNVHLSPHAAESASYRGLSKKIDLPKYVNRSYLAHRWAYIR